MDFIRDRDLINEYQTNLNDVLLALFNQNQVRGNVIYNYNNGLHNWYSNPAHGGGVPHFLNLFGKFDSLTGIDVRMLVGINFEMDPPYGNPQTPAGFFQRESDGHILIGHKGVFKCRRDGRQGNLNRNYFYQEYGLINTFEYGNTRFAIVADINANNVAKQVLDFVSKVIAIKNQFGCE